MRLRFEEITGEWTGSLEKSLRWLGVVVWWLWKCSSVDSLTSRVSTSRLLAVAGMAVTALLSGSYRLLWKVNKHTSDDGKLSEEKYHRGEVKMGSVVLQSVVKDRLQSRSSGRDLNFGEERARPMSAEGEGTEGTEPAKPSKFQQGLWADPVLWEREL